MRLSVCLHLYYAENRSSNRFNAWRGCYCGPKGVQCWILVQYGHDMFKINELQYSASRTRHVSRGQGLYLTWEHKHSLKLLGIFVAIAKNTLYGSKLSIFMLCQKSLGY